MEYLIDEYVEDTTSIVDGVLYVRYRLALEGQEERFSFHIPLDHEVLGEINDRRVSLRERAGHDVGKRRGQSGRQGTGKPRGARLERKLG